MAVNSNRIESAFEAVREWDGEDDTDLMRQLCARLDIEPYDLMRIADTLDDELMAEGAEDDE